MGRQNWVSAEEPTEKGGFVGEFAHSLDSKKRLTIPSQWREKSGSEKLFALPGIELKCVYVITEAEMELRMAKVREFSLTNEKAQNFIRLFLSKTEEVVLDSQGRIRVGDRLLDHAALTNEVVMIGVGKRFELWSPELWKEHQSAHQGTYAEAARSIGF